jgi:hypothetical protein
MAAGGSDENQSAFADGSRADMKSDIMDGSMRTPPITISLMKPKFWRKA